MKIYSIFLKKAKNMQTTPSAHEHDHDDCCGHDHFEGHHHHHEGDNCCGHDHGPGCACEADLLENIDKEVDAKQSKKDRKSVV